jgi:fucose permease
MTRQIRRTPLFASACGGLFIYGIVLAVLGTIFGLPQTRERLHLDLAHQGHVLLLLYLGVLLANMIVGPIIDSLGHKIVMVCSALLVAASLVGLAAAHSFLSVIPAAVLLGFSGGGLCTASNVLVSDLYTEGRGGMLNLVGVFFGIGEVLLPLLAVAAEARFSVAALLWLLAILTAVGGLAYSAMAFPPPRDAGGVSIIETLRVARYPGLVWLGMLLFVEAGNEATMGGWVSTYAGSMGLKPSAATLVLACYWGGMTVGRLLAMRYLNSFGKTRAILCSAVVSIFGAALLLSVHTLLMLGLASGILGLAFAPIFQTTLGIAGDRYEKHSGSVFGLMFVFALVGSMAQPWLVGQISERFAVRLGMVIPLVGTVIVSCLASYIRRTSEQAKELARQAEAEAQA